MKHSLSYKIAFMVLIFSLLTIGISFLVCNFILEDYFKKDEEKQLVRIYDSCNELMSNRNTGDSGYGDLFGYISNPIGASVFIIDNETMNVYSTIRMNQMANNNIRKVLDTFDFTTLEDHSDYTMYIDEDKKNNEYMNCLVGYLDNGSLIIIETPAKVIDSNVKFFFKLFMIVCASVMVFGTIVVLFISQIFSHPLRKMATVAERMTELDFDAKVDVKSQDEIGELGKCMNELSTKLEETISELKTANIELSKDISKKIQIDEMRKEFLSHVSHELKTPIAIIQGYAEGLKDNISDDPESREFYCDVIVDESTKMNALVMKLLELNEMEFGNNAPDIQRFELTLMISSIIKASSILAEEKKVNIIFDEEEPLEVWADEYLMEQVFTNYLTNAIHYAKEAGEIKVYFEKKERTVRVNVFNEGENIADKDIDKVFVKFYKADVARTREYGGSGIGLSIVAAAMEAHKKEYGVYNVENGVVFYFELDCQAMEN